MRAVEDRGAGTHVVENTAGEFVASFATHSLADFFVDEGSGCYRHRTPAPAGDEGFLSHLRRVNTERYHAWVGDGHDADILFDAAELGGEVGGLLNVVKKLEREERGWRGSRAAPEDFADECADVLICLDKLARRRGVDLEAATIGKFNATSVKVDLPHRLSASTTTKGDDEFNRGVLISASTLINAWGESTQTEYLLRMIGADVDMVNRMDFTDYDRDPLVKALTEGHQ